MIDFKMFQNRFFNIDIIIVRNLCNLPKKYFNQNMYFDFFYYTYSFSISQNNN